MRIDTGRDKRDCTAVDLETGEELMVRIPGAVAPFYPPLVSIGIGHRILPNGAIGMTLTFRGNKPFVVVGQEAIIVLSGGAAKGDMFMEDEHIYYALDKMKFPKSAGIGELVDDWMEVEDYDDR